MFYPLHRFLGDGNLVMGVLFEFPRLGSNKKQSYWLTVQDLFESACSFLKRWAMTPHKFFKSSSCCWECFSILSFYLSTLRYHYLRYPELFWQYLQSLWINIPPFLQQTVCGNILKVVFVSCLCNLWQTLLFCFYSFAIQVFVLSLGSMMVQGFFCSLMAFNMNSIV